MPALRTAEMLYGALVADAATLGLHWMYDPERIARIATDHGNSAAFTPVSADLYDGAKGVFVHGNRRLGMNTQYGEVLRLAITNINDTNGVFDTATYQAAYAAHFGAGGPYAGYIDRPTKGALANIAARSKISGIDDDQLPATATLPALYAAYRGHAEMTDQILTAMNVTNVNDIATHHATFFGTLLLRVLAEGMPMDDALKVSIAEADPSIRSALVDALHSPETDSVAYGAVTGRACHLPQAAPLIVHILARSTSVQDALERNIRAGGDSAGRAILVGALIVAVHGIGGAQGLPLEWALRLDKGAEIWAACQHLAAHV